MGFDSKEDFLNHYSKFFCRNRPRWTSDYILDRLDPELILFMELLLLTESYYEGMDWRVHWCKEESIVMYCGVYRASVGITYRGECYGMCFTAISSGNPVLIKIRQYFRAVFPFRCRV